MKEFNIRANLSYDSFDHDIRRCSCLRDLQKFSLMMGSAIGLVGALPAMAQTSDTSESFIVVTAQQEIPVNSGKSDIPLLETPQIISVISADLIKEQGVTRLADALRNSAGVSQGSIYGFFDGFTIRGFDASVGSLYQDGLISENGAGTNYELAALEQVEVVKGPASALFGAGSLGGLINLVSKRPKNDLFANMSLSTGSFDLIEGTVDLNSPLDSKGIFTARINALYRDADSFIDFASQNRLFVAPALNWNLGAETNLTLLATYQRDRDHPYSPVDAYGTVLPNANGVIPVSFSVNGPGDKRAIFNQDRKAIGYSFHHGFTDNLTFDQILRYTKRDLYYDNWIFGTGYVGSQVIDGVQQSRTLARAVYGPLDAKFRDFAVDSRVGLKLNTGSLNHTLMFGVDYRTQNADQTGLATTAGALNPLDAFDPDYSRPYVASSTPYDLTSSTESSQLGFYIQDHVKWGRLTVTASGRWDRAKANGLLDTAFSPRVGATYEFIDGAAIYTNFSKSFTSQAATSIIVGGGTNGAPLQFAPAPPQRGRILETGIKFAPVGSKVSGTLSVYELTRLNVLTTNLDFPLYSEVSGEQQSKGVEVEGQWRPLTSLSLTVAYAYIDAKVTKDNRRRVGTPIANIPKHNLNVTGRYVVPAGPLENLGFTVGLTYNSKKNGAFGSYNADGGSLLELPSYVLLDGGVSYGFGDWKAQVNVGNILDKRYYPDSNGIFRVSQGRPRNWRLSVSRSF